MEIYSRLEIGENGLNVFKNGYLSGKHLHSAWRLDGRYTIKRFGTVTIDAHRKNASFIQSG
jgi:hypothetical protein